MHKIEKRRCEELMESRGLENNGKIRKWLKEGEIDEQRRESRTGEKYF